MTQVPDTLTDQYGDIFKKDNKAKDILNKMFSANLLAVYTCEKISYNKGKRLLDWGNEVWYFINAKGVYGKMNNSEWAFFSTNTLAKDFGLSEGFYGD